MLSPEPQPFATVNYTYYSNGRDDQQLSMLSVLDNGKGNGLNANDCGLKEAKVK